MSVSLVRRIKKIWKWLHFRRRKDLTGVSYWENRVKNHGKRAVLNLNHGSEEYDTITDFQRREIFPYLNQVIQPSDRIFLDLGCGPGRFTSELASTNHGGLAIGVDPILGLISMAPKSPNVAFAVMTEGVIPLSNESVDVVWSCLVLGGISGVTLSATIEEIKRVLKKGGLLFLVENTSPLPIEMHWIFRQFVEYRQLFPFVHVTHLHDYFDIGERISIMAGRKT